MNDYEIVVGLEVHAELSTESKMYCNCKNEFGLEVNTRVCPICMALPGALPTLNETAVDYAVMMGHALNCKINSVSKQDRKNYFYPDLPKAYQISQAEVPVCENGHLDIIVDGDVRRIGITRIHIEEDAGKLLHDDSFDGSLVDCNRGGVPLIEIVSEPDIRSSAEAKAFLDMIKLTLQYLDISDCKMQEGSIRCDVNVSVRKMGEKEFGTRCEMKNVNSFSAAVRGIEYESKRQIELIEAGGTVEQETRRWDDVKGESVTLRSKEDAHDYRYFPEPDLLTIVIPDEKIEQLKQNLPELPSKKMMHYMIDLGISQTEAMLLVESDDKSKMFDECEELGADPNTALNWILGDISKYMNESGKSIFDTNLTSQKLYELISLIQAKTISNAAGRIVFEELLHRDTDVKTIIEEKGLAQISDKDALLQIAKKVVEDNAQSVDDYNNGKTNALGYLVGQCMKTSKGKANPSMMKELILSLIKE